MRIERIWEKPYGAGEHVKMHYFKTVCKPTDINKVHLRPDLNVNKRDPQGEH